MHNNQEARGMGIFRKKIAAKLTLQSCMLVLVMVLAVGGISFYKSSEAITHEVEARISSELTSLINQLESEMKLVSEKLNMVGSLEMVMGYETHPESYAPISSILKTILTQNVDSLETIFITNSKGVIVMDGSEGQYLKTDISDRGYFKEAMAGKAVWSGIVTSKVSNQPVRVYAYPLKDKSGKIIGILSAAVKLEPIKAQILAAKVGDSGYAYMLDHEGNVIFHTNEALVGKNINNLGIPELVEELPKIAAGESGQVIYTFDKVTKLNVYAPFDQYSISLNAAQKEYLKPVTDMGMTIIWIGVIFMVLGSVISYIIALIFGNKIKKVQDIARRASEGDLTVRVPGKDLQGGDELDQMGLSVNQMLNAFNHVIGEIIHASEVMSSTSQQMAASAVEGGKAATEVTCAIQEISAGLQEQAEFVLKSNRTVEDMQHKIEQTASETITMSLNAEKVMLTAKDSQGHMKSTMHQMDEIQASSMTTFNIIQTLSNQSEQIGQISSAISSIADQTNLLALNAAIEAARAGEQGKGFAVVAEEIRKLASESMSSADSIGKLINQIQSEIERAESAIQDESQSISKGVSVIGETQSAFGHIIEAIQSTIGIMETVKACTESTKQSTFEVVNSVNYISKVTQEASSNAEEVNASTEEQNAIAEEIASASEHISQLAVNLLEQVSTFKVSR